MALNRTQERGNALLRCLKQLFDDGTYSDLTIEGESGVIHLPEDDPSAVKAMLHYFYYLDYSFMAVPVVDTDEAAMSRPFTFRCAYPPNDFTQIGPATGPGRAPLSKKDKKKMKMQSRTAQPSSQRPESVPATPNLCLHAKVYALGEKYGIEDLKGLALDKFHAEAEHHWQSDNFLHAIREVYTSTIDEDRTLRDVVVEVVNAHPELLDQPRWQDSIKDLGLCFDLLMRSRCRRPVSQPRLLGEIYIDTERLPV
ncbi:hypothetical protein FPRO03_13840 [Fusarium proliferatum]|nr:hypothetical protein FPRO03_13840 [Fusarium proliferatum]